MSKKQKDEPILADEMLGKSEAFVIRHKNVITYTVAAILVAVLGYIIYQKFIVEPKEKEAMIALQEPMYQSLIGKNDYALEGANAVIENHSGTDAANVANIIAGSLTAYELGNYEEAIAIFEEYDGNDDIIAPKVKHALGNCYSHTGDTDKAIELLLEAAEEANNEAVTPLCWRDLAAMYEQQGKKEEAINLYERIKTEYPGCMLVLSGEIDSQLAIIK
ncbi:MAG: tetratricopeptide repeat protein [Bacteroidaceae bacterium]|nr:tetratricopeptide repeat protein [Bacteroidaceae bacterium]